MNAPKGVIPYVFSATSCKKHMEYIRDHIEGTIDYIVPDQQDPEKVVRIVQ